MATGSERDRKFQTSWWGEHPIAGGWFSSHVLGMKPNPFSPDANQKSAKGQKQNPVENFNRSKPAPTPSPEAVARRAYAIYEKQGSPPGHEVKHWLEAEAQLCGGVERESQMHPGSSLFTTEH